MSAEPLAPSLAHPPEPLALAIRRFRPGDPGRLAVEGFVSQRYRDTHGATRCHFLEHLIAVFDGQATCLGTLGLGLASQGPLFVEAYLDAPIERLLPQPKGPRAPRSQIVEVGNLASRSPRAGFALILWSIVWLSGHGVHWAVFSATAQVRDRLAQLGIRCPVIAEARPERLGDRARDWGEYYENDPRVVVASVLESRRVMDLAPSDIAPLAAAAWVDGRRARAC